MLERENEILNKLVGKFVSLDGKGTVQRERRIFIQVPGDIFMDVLRYAYSELGFSQLCTITGLDSGDCYLVIYHLADDSGDVLSLTLRVEKDNAVIKSVLDIYNGSIYYEKELEDLLGIKVDGLPKGRHYPLPDDWPEGQYPLRKDWKQEMPQNR